MHILGTPFDDIDIDFIARLIDERVPESLTHDYKSRLPDRRDVQAKQRVLSSAAAFANTSGGVFVVGVDGSDWALPGLREFDEDQDVLRVKDLLRSGIDPWLPRATPRVLRRS